MKEGRGSCQSVSVWTDSDNEKMFIYIPVDEVRGVTEEKSSGEISGDLLIKTNRQSVIRVLQLLL